MLHPPRTSSPSAKYFGGCGGGGCGGDSSPESSVRGRSMYGVRRSTEKRHGSGLNECGILGSPACSARGRTTQPSSALRSGRSTSTGMAAHQKPYRSSSDRWHWSRTSSSSPSLFLAVLLRAPYDSAGFVAQGRGESKVGSSSTYDVVTTSHSIDEWLERHGLALPGLCDPTINLSHRPVCSASASTRASIQCRRSEGTENQSRTVLTRRLDYKLVPFPRTESGVS